MRTGQLSGYVRGEFFGVGSSGSEEQHRPQPLGQGLGAQAWPVAADLRRQSPVEFVGEDLVQRHGTDGVFDHFDGTTQTAQPVGHLIRVGHRAAQKQQLRLRWSQCQGQFVVQSSVFIAEHLVLVDDEQGGAIASDEPVFLCFEGGDKNWGVEVLGQVAGGDAYVPAPGSPFSQLVVGQRPSGHCVNGLTPVSARLRPQFEHQRLAGACGRMDDHVLARSQCRHGLLLPQVRNNELLQARRWIGGFRWGSERRHA